MLVKTNRILFFLLLLTSCNHIEPGYKLRNDDITRIQKLNLLDKNETVYKFYSEYKRNIAGNFFTNKRLATYWIDEKGKSKNKIAFAFYQDIKSIDTVYNAGVIYCPYMLITRKDSSQFTVCVNGKRNEIKSFFEDAIDKWKENKQYENHQASIK